jgi:hypothetical protein
MTACRFGDEDGNTLVDANAVVSVGEMERRSFGYIPPGRLFVIFFVVVLVVVVVRKGEGKDEQTK